MPLVRVPSLALCSTPASNPPSVRTSLVASLVASQVVLEDDVELTTSAHAVSSDIHKCDALGAAGGCTLLLLGYVDAYWATHALYVTPAGARRLLATSDGWCAPPTDYHTHRLCVGDAGKDESFEKTASPSSWHRSHALEGNRCLAANTSGASSGGGGGDSGVSSNAARAIAAALGGAGVTRLAFRPPELYGMGHFVQNRTRAYIHGGNGFALVNLSSSRGQQGANC